MNLKPLMLVAAGLVASILAAATAFAQHAVFPSPFSHPDRARFRLVVEEGLAQPDGRAFIPGVKIWIIADTVAGTCQQLTMTPSGQSSLPVVCP